MNLRTLSPEELSAVYDGELRAAFPPAELKPLSSMEAMRRRGLYDPLGVFDEAGEFLGCALLWKHPDRRFLLIDYLCVCAARRNHGLGGEILRALTAAYPPDAVLIAESEAPVGDPERDGLIRRRLNFYRRNGAVLMDYECALFGVRYKNLYWAAAPLPEAQVLQKHREIYQNSLRPRWFDRYIQIPLAPGEAAIPVTDWRES